MKKIKITKQRTIFNKDKSIKLDDFYKVKYYFNGKDFCKILDYRYEIKNTKVWVFLKTDKGNFIEKISFQTSDNIKYLKIFYDEFIPALYYNIEDFAKDLEDYIFEQNKLKQQYYDRYIIKCNDIKNIKNNFKELFNELPEYFI